MSKWFSQILPTHSGYPGEKKGSLWDLKARKSHFGLVKYILVDFSETPCIRLKKKEMQSDSKISVNEVESSSTQQLDVIFVCIFNIHIMCSL